IDRCTRTGRCGLQGKSAHAHYSVARTGTTRSCAFTQSASVECTAATYCDPCTIIDPIEAGRATALSKKQCAAGINRNVTRTAKSRGGRVVIVDLECTGVDCSCTGVRTRAADCKCAGAGLY